MDEKIDINDFDILGIIDLRNANGIEKYCTPVLDENRKCGKIFIKK